MSWVHLNQQGKVNSHLLTHTLETTLEAGIIACKVGNKEDGSKREIYEIQTCHCLSTRN